MSNQFAIETSTIGLTLWNPTNEDLDMQYAGISLTMKAGEERAYEIACAKHLLNGFGPRGLTSLKYGCTDADKKAIGEAAVQRNIDFKKKQIVEYNQRNENRKQMGLGYLPATEAVKKYSIELGLKLLEPYSVRDEERSDIGALKAENSELKGQVKDLLGKFEQLMKELANKKNADFDCPHCRRTFGTHEELEDHIAKNHRGKG